MIKKIDVSDKTIYMKLQKIKNYKISIHLHKNQDILQLLWKKKNHAIQKIFKLNNRKNYIQKRRWLTRSFKSYQSKSHIVLCLRLCVWPLSILGDEIIFSHFQNSNSTIKQILGAGFFFFFWPARIWGSKLT